MSLDLFDRNIDDAVNYAARVSAPELPSTFSDNWNDAWNRGFMVSQSVSGTNRKIEARSQLVDDAIAKTGDRSLGQFISPDGSDSDFDGFNRRLAEIGTAGVQPLTAEAIQMRADDIGSRQLSESRSLDRRESTLGGSVGSFLGSAAASIVDPVNLVAFPLAAPTSLGILGTALAWGGIGAGSQAVIEGMNISSMERIQPGYTDSAEPLQNILGAGLAGGVLGGGLKGLSNLWSRAKTGQWPRTVRDAGNVIESEAQITATNPLPGVEGEAVHRTALNKAIDDIANGRPVDVDGIVPPQLAPHIEAWHGSPHDFDRFDISHIGSGEGAQAYGHGLYFAENQGVARSYQLMDDAKINGKPFDINNPVHKAASLVDEYGSLDAAIKEAAGRMKHDPGDFYGDVLMHLESGRQLPQLDTAGKVYKVRITADKDRMLDWDRRLSEQSEFVRSKLLAAGFADEQTGKEIYQSLVKYRPNQGGATSSAGMKFSDLDATPEAASGRLRATGVTGIKYLDQGSRAVDIPEGLLTRREDIDARLTAIQNLTEDQRTVAVNAEYDALIKEREGVNAEIRQRREDVSTRNFVVFDDKHIQITHKNGKQVNAEVRQSVVDQASGLPPKQPELGLAPPAPAKPAGPNAETVKALDAELTPVRREEMRTDVDVEETISRDLDKLMLERPDMEVPTGVIVDAEGRSVPTTRKVESVVAEADARLAAAKEIEACAGPYPASEAA